MTARDEYQMAASEQYSVDPYSWQAAYAYLEATPGSYCDLSETPRN